MQKPITKIKIKKLKIGKMFFTDFSIYYQNCLKKLAKKTSYLQKLDLKLIPFFFRII